MTTPTPDEIRRERQRLADLDYFDPLRETTDRYDRREGEDGYNDWPIPYEDEDYRDRAEEAYNEMLMNGGDL